MENVYHQVGTKPHVLQTAKLFIKGCPKTKNKKKKNLKPSTNEAHKAIHSEKYLNMNIFIVIITTIQTATHEKVNSCQMEAKSLRVHSLYP
jgi:hypothetical protein